jgi:hypothetical protein
MKQIDQYDHQEIATEVTNGYLLHAGNPSRDDSLQAGWNVLSLRSVVPFLSTFRPARLWAQPGLSPICLGKTSGNDEGKDT